MKILFVTKEMKMEHLGIMYLIAALKRAGHQTFLSRMDVYKSPKFKIGRIMPDFVCYSVCSGSEQYYFDLDERIRKDNPHNTFISVYGGPAVTFNPELFKGKTYIRGEAEEALINLVEGKPYTDLTLVDINRLEFPDRALFYSYHDTRNNPIKNIMTRRGCKFGCTYCFNRDWNKLHQDQIKNNTIRVRKINSVINEIKLLRKNWQPLKTIHIMDDNFATPIEWLRKFAPKYKKEINIPFICNVNPQNLTDEVAQLLSLAGCDIVSLAIESANDNNRRKILNRTGNKQLVIDAINRCNKYNIRTRLQNIIGLPVPESLEDAYETLDFNIEANPTSSWCAILQCYRGTKIYEIAESGGYLPKNGEVDEGFFGISTLKLKNKVLIERLHKLWPLITAYPNIFRRITPLLIRIPLPFSVYRYIFTVSKKYLTEKNLWKVYNDKTKI